MKTLTYVALVISLLANAAFALLLVSGNREPQMQHRVAAPAATTPAAPALNAEVWNGLVDPDPATAVTRLRAAGFPPNVVRTILAALIAEKYSARRKALAEDGASVPFWKERGMDPKRLAALREIDHEQQEELNRLLGPDSPAGSDFNAHNVAFLPAEKAATLKQIFSDFDQRRENAFANGFFDRAKFEALQKGEHDAIAAALAPEELFDYDIRNSNTARMLRDRLSAFSPNEDEFRAIYRLQAAFDAQYNNGFMVGGSSDEMRQRMEAQKQLTTDIKAALSPDRAAIYDKVTDYNYVRTTQLVSRLELPPETTDSLSTAQQDFDQRRRDLNQDSSLSKAERELRMAALHQEAVDRVAGLLHNPGAVDTYRQYGGQWLDMLLPRSQRPASPFDPPPPKK